MSDMQHSDASKRRIPARVRRVGAAPADINVVADVNAVIAYGDGSSPATATSRQSAPIVQNGRHRAGRRAGDTDQEEEI